MELEQQAASLIRRVLQNGGSLEGIANELGKQAVLYPTPVLPTYDMLFDAQIGLEMQNAYYKGILHVERMDLTNPAN
jgi:hypothetical protein